MLQVELESPICTTLQTNLQKKYRWQKTREFKIPVEIKHEEITKHQPILRTARNIFGFNNFTWFINILFVLLTGQFCFRWSPSWTSPTHSVLQMLMLLSCTGVGVIPKEGTKNMKTSSGLIPFVCTLKP